MTLKFSGMPSWDFFFHGCIYDGHTCQISWSESETVIWSWFYDIFLRNMGWADWSPRPLDLGSMTSQSCRGGFGVLIFVLFFCLFLLELFVLWHYAHVAKHNFPKRRRTNARLYWQPLDTLTLPRPVAHPSRGGDDGQKEETAGKEEKENLQRAQRQTKWITTNENTEASCLTWFGHSGHKRMVSHWKRETPKRVW